MKSRDLNDLKRIRSEEQRVVVEE